MRLIEAIVVDWCLNVSQQVHLGALLATRISFQSFKPVILCTYQDSLSNLTNKNKQVRCNLDQTSPTITNHQPPKTTTTPTTIPSEKVGKHSQNVPGERKPVSADRSTQKTSPKDLCRIRQEPQRRKEPIQDFHADLPAFASVKTSPRRKFTGVDAHIDAASRRLASAPKTFMVGGLSPSYTRAMDP